jgi:hypothetical protein
MAMCVAAAHRLSCEYAFSHATAALIHGCWLWRVDGLTHITQTARPSSVVAGGLKRHLGALPDADIAVVSGLRVTSLERTVEDCARTMHPRHALAVADSALRILARPDRRRREESARRMEEVRERILARLHRRVGVRGIVRARAVLGSADGFSESAGETDLRWVALTNGLPRPTCQMPVVAESGRYYADLGWRFEGSRGEPFTVVMEYDGAAKYDAGAGVGDGRILYAEKRREDAIRDVVSVFQRYGAADLRRPGVTFARMLRAFPPDVRGRLRPVTGLRVLPSARA